MMLELRDKLEGGKFVITVELEPPKGINTDKVVYYSNQLRDRVDAINITDCPMANLRMSPIAIAHIIRTKANLDAIFHLTCRDRNIIGLQSELLGAAALGVKNLLILTGDPPSVGDHPKSKGVFEVDSTGLVHIANTLKNGNDMSGNPLNESPNFNIGVAANPCAKDMSLEMEKLISKIEKGANFIQTQPVFDLEALNLFLEKVRHFYIPVIAGILPLKSMKMTRHIIEHIPGIEIPNWVEERMKQGGRPEGIKIAVELLSQFRNMTQGVHIMPVGDANIVLEILEEEE